MPITRALCTAWALLLAAPAVANDTVISLAAGSIVPMRTTAVHIVSEDLYISRDVVRVRFEFRNETDNDIETNVAFVLPDIDMGVFSNETMGASSKDPVNFVDFRTSVDGRPIMLRMNQRAYMKGKDITPLLQGAGVRLNLANVSAKDPAYMRIFQLSPALRRSLTKIGAIVWFGNDDFRMDWVVRTRLYWPQRFPAHRRVVIEHSYRPVTGAGGFSAQNWMKRTDAYGDVNYCFDKPTWVTLRRRSDVETKKDPMGGGYFGTGYWTDYVLKSAANWRGPIGQFHLTLDKLKRNNILSICWDGPLKKTGPTTFEFTAENYTPTRGIHMLVVE